MRPSLIAPSAGFLCGCGSNRAAAGQRPGEGGALDRDGPDGLLYLLTDDADGALLRLRPAAAGPLAAGAAAGTT
jgi:hypothetical protein